jgi:cytochrome P450
MSADSIKAYFEHVQCKPGSARGCLASLLKDKSKDTKAVDAATFTAMFLPVIIAGMTPVEITLITAVDTICAILTFALWDLARFPEFRKRAAEEVAKFFPSRDDMTIAALEDLPFLNAFLHESMRFHGISVSLNERIAPEGGAMVSDKAIPAGVVPSSFFNDVRLPPYVIHGVGQWTQACFPLQRLSTRIGTVPHLLTSL